VRAVVQKFFHLLEDVEAIDGAALEQHGLCLSREADAADQLQRLLHQGQEGEGVVLEQVVDQLQVQHDVLLKRVTETLKPA